MPLASNPFSQDTFGAVALTAAINLLPNRYGRVEEMGLMPARPVRLRNIAIEERNGVLSLLPTAVVGSPGTVGTRGKRKIRSFVIPHIPHDDVVLPEEVQGIRAFGTEGELAAMADVMALHLQSMRDKHAIIPRTTLELRPADLGFDPLAGDEVTVGGVSYRVREAIPDGAGSVLLILDRLPSP